MISKIYNALTIVLVLICVQTAFTPFEHKMVAEDPQNVTIIYNNGGFRTGDMTERGVAAPDGYFWSENQHDSGNMTEANTTLGYGVTLTQSGNRLVDNFTIPAGQRPKITSVTLQAYVSG